MPRSKKQTKWKLSKLKEHPKQEQLFGKQPDVERQELTVDMKRRGQQQPVVILPDGTIIAGHQRVAAAKILGWKEIEVVVRHDLADDAAVEMELIADNLYRRHLSPLTIARCMKRSMELEARTGTLGRGKMEELKRKLARQFSKSLRSVNRYLLLLEAPPAIQQAMERGQISLNNAGKVALLDKEQQKEIARRITNGEKVKTVVAEYLESRSVQSTPPWKAVSRLAYTLRCYLTQFDGRTNELRPDHIQPCLRTLDKGGQLIDELKRIAGKKRHGRSADLKWVARDEEE